MSAPFLGLVSGGGDGDGILLFLFAWHGNGSSCCSLFLLFSIVLEPQGRGGERRRVRGGAQGGWGVP
jgi:hypothetical protein